MLILTNIVESLYRIFPDASIGGKYVIDYINGEIKGINRIDLVINSEITDDYIDTFKRVFGENIIKIERIIEFDELRPSHLSVKLRNVETLAVFTILVVNDLENQNFFSVNNFLISPSGEIRKRSRNQISNGMRDISVKKLKTNYPLNVIRDGLDRRYSYLRMIEFVESMTTSPGWKIDQQISPYFKIREPAQNSTEFCAICRDAINDASSIQLQCNHWYHVDCIKGHLSGVGPRHERCPICRKEII